MNGPSRVLVFAPNWLGDAVMALPAVADIRRHFPAATLAVAARAKVAPMFAWVPGVDEVVTFAHAGGPRGKASERDVHALADGGFDLAILLPNSFRVAWLARRARIVERWGYRRDLRGWLLTRGARVARGFQHQAEYYQALTSALGMPNGPRAARLEPPADARARGVDVLRAHGCPDTVNLVGMAPGAAYGHAKRWLPERFAELAGSLADAGNTTVLVGSREDADAGAAIEQALARLRSRDAADRIVNVIGRTDLGALAGVMVACRAFVSNDSGAMHLAAAMGVPVVAVFGASDERATSPLPFADAGPAGTGGERGHGPSVVRAVKPPVILTNPVWCRPCMLRECPIDHRCMVGISAERVFEAVMEVAGSR
jgi:heptosyltransferase II